MTLVGRQQIVKGKERDQSKKERKAFIEFSSELQHSKGELCMDVWEEMNQIFQTMSKIAQLHSIRH